MPEPLTLEYALGSPVKVRVGEQDYAGEVSHLGLEPAQSDPAIEPRYRLDVSFRTGGDALRPGQPLVLP